jgi:hypothetical protein
VRLLFVKCLFRRYEAAGLWNDLLAESKALGLIDNNLAKTCTELLEVDNQLSQHRTLAKLGFANPLTLLRDLSELGLLFGLPSCLNIPIQTTTAEILHMSRILASLENIERPICNEHRKDSIYGAGKIGALMGEAAWYLRHDRKKAAKLFGKALERKKKEGNPDYRLHALNYVLKFLEQSKDKGKKNLQPIVDRLCDADAIKRLFTLQCIPSAGLSSWPIMRLSNRKGSHPQGIQLTSLRRWGSDVSLFDWTKDSLGTVGGGYVIETKKNGRIMIDPGLDFLRAFFSYMQSPLRGTQCILVSHEHIDHAGDLEKLILTLHKMKEQTDVISPQAYGGMVRYWVWQRAQCPKAMQKPDMPNSLVSYHCKKQNECEKTHHCPSAESVVKRLLINTDYKVPHDGQPWLTVEPFSVQHLEQCVTKIVDHTGNVTSSIDYSCGYDIHIRDGKWQYRIIYTGDAAFVPELNKDKIHILIANLGSVKSAELLGQERPGGNHLGLTRLVNLIVQLEPEAVVISELLYSLSHFDWRLDCRSLLIKMLNEKMPATAVPPIFFTEVGFSLSLQKGKVHAVCACTAFSERFPFAAKVQQVKPKYRFYDKSESLIAVCRDCEPRNRPPIVHQTAHRMR